MDLDLDFSKLFSIGQQGTQKGRTEPFTPKGVDFPIEEEKPAETPKGRAVIKLQREQEDHKNSMEMYSIYQQNIKRAGTLRSEILKGLRAGEDPRAILLKAVECISLMTGDVVIYAQSKKDLIEKYGMDLGERKKSGEQ